MLRLNHITFASEEPARLAEFWATLLDGYSVDVAHLGFGWNSERTVKSAYLDALAS